MFTQCSKCETVFRLSADALRAARGQVRCGRCGEVFDALSRLAEQSAAFNKGESPLFLEARAEELLETRAVEAPPAFAEIDVPPGVEIAQLHFLEPIDDDLVAETSLEFTLPPDELDRIFIETRPSPLRRLTADTAHAETIAEPPFKTLATIAPTSAITPANTITPATAISPASAIPPASTGSLHAVPTAPPPPHPEKVRVPRADLSIAELAAINPPPRRLPFFAWLTAGIVLALLLVLQILRANGTWLAVHAPLLAAASSMPPGLSAYQLRQWGVTGDPGANGTLRVRASIMNADSQLHAYPLLRVTLVNRFGARIGAREFGPAEYLGHDTARMLAPGERLDATVDILDPGKDAEGFEIDVCIRNSDQKIICAGDAATQSK